MKYVSKIQNTTKLDADQVTKLYAWCKRYVDQCRFWSYQEAAWWFNDYAGFSFTVTPEHFRSLEQQTSKLVDGNRVRFSKRVAGK